ncbi:MAG: heme NO-binding domain-containing protein, partial [Acidimicrobiia bacterium]
MTPRPSSSTTHRSPCVRGSRNGSTIGIAERRPVVGCGEHDRVKGLFFNLAQEVVEDRWGPDRWDDAVALAGVDGAYTWLGTYPDADLFALVRALA